MKLNNKLFGKITTITQRGVNVKYYYPGLLEDQQYFKLSNGCYFIIGEILEDNLYQLINAELDIHKTQTAREHWEKFIEKNEIKNKVRNFK